MKIVIAPDSFKECLAAREVAAALAAGWARAWPESEVVCVPMADGGEGTVDAVAAASGGTLHTTRVCGPLGNTVDATWVLLPDGVTAVIEMAAAAGLALVADDERDPHRTTTRGVGELILAAMDAGATRIIVGLGGSATNDGGAGMAQALGYRLLDTQDNDLPPGGAALADLARMDASNRDARLDAVTLIGATDVVNPLCGPEGASAVFGPQKGASPDSVKELDAALAHYAELLEKELGIAIADVPGAGAAGGLGAGLIAFAGAALRPGADLVAEACGLRAALDGARLVITGEGCFDAQSLAGKTPMGVAALAAEYGVPAIIVAGTLGEGWQAAYGRGVTALFSLTASAISADDARLNASAHLEAMGESLARLWRAV